MYFQQPSRDAQNVSYLMIVDNFFFVHFCLLFTFLSPQHFGQCQTGASACTHIFYCTIFHFLPSVYPQNQITLHKSFSTRLYERIFLVTQSAFINTGNTKTSILFNTYILNELVLTLHNVTVCKLRYIKIGGKIIYLN